MSKAVSLILLLSVALIFFPLFAFGATINLTVNITSFRAPTRAAASNIANPNNVEFGLSNYRAIVVENNTNTVVATNAFSPNSMYSTAPFTSGPFTFTYNSNYTYSVYLEVLVYSQGANTVCKVDCSNVPANSGWYILSQSALYASGIGTATCSTPIPCNCSGAACNNVAVDPNNVVKESDNNYYWRDLLQVLSLS